MASVSKGSSSKQKSRSGVQFPSDFLTQLGKAGLQLPFRTQDILGGLPGTRNLFTGEFVGLQPGGGGVGGTGQGVGPPPAPGSQFFPGGGGGGGAPPKGSPRPVGSQNFRITPQQILDQFARAPSSSKTPGRVQGLLNESLRTGRIKFDQPLSLDELQGIVGEKEFARLTDLFAPVLQQEQVTQQIAGAPAPFATTGPGGLALDNRQAIANLGFGQAPPTFQEATIREAPQIASPDVLAAQANIAPRGFEQFQRDIFESTFRPQERQIQQAGELADRQLRAELAQAGTASSVSGQALIEERRRQREEQLNFQSNQAATQASAQRFGLEFAQEQQNAQLRQQANLEQAGFDFNSQVQNAQNLLAGDTARADNYLRTIGLNQQVANDMRDDFLQLLGVQQSELQRLEASSLQQLGAIMNAFLQQGALLGNLGQVSEGEARSGGGSGISVLNILGGTAQSG